MLRIKIFIILVFLFSLIYAGNLKVEGAICVGSEICSNYNVNCNSVSDDFCPENYGNWGACEWQTYGKCTPCDPDCGICGDPNTGATIEMISEGKANPCELIDFIVRANLNSVPDTMRIFEGTSITGPELYSYVCNQADCTNTIFNHTVSCTGGDDECLTATTDNLITSGIKITKCIEINPQVTASVVGVSGANPSLSGLIQLNANVKSLQGVTSAKVYGYKKDPRTNTFKPVNFNTNPNNADYCSFRCDPVTQPNCNLLGEQQIFTLPSEQNFVFNFDTTKCDNKEFKFEMIGYDGRDNFNKDEIGDQSEFTLTINNPNPVCIDECILFNSKLLNTVYFKIKSWIA